MSVNQFIKPITTQRQNNLMIGGCDLVELAKKYKTPLYVIDETTLRTVCKEYKEGFKNYPNIRMTYASKALCNLAISKILAQEGFGFDVVSAGEIYTVHKSGADMSKVTFNGNNKSEEELNLALDLDIGVFSVDNFLEAARLNILAERKNKMANILLRITPGIECHTHEYIKTGQIDSKFGFDLHQIDSIITLVKEKYNNLNLKGLHAHIGSQVCEPDCYNDELEILINELVRINKKFGLNLNEINIGGGLGVKYTESDTPLSVSDFCKNITNSIDQLLNKSSIKDLVIYIEPGRSIVSTSGVTLYTVGSSKKVTNGRKYVAIDGGMADNPRPAMYKANYSTELANSAQDRPNEVVTIAGRYCESGDVLIENIELPELHAGDILCVYNTGAYNYSMASNYNRVGKPAMVLVNNSQSDIIVNRESLEDLVALDSIPDRLNKE